MTEPEIETTLGGCVWLGLAGLVASALGVGAALYASRAQSRPAEVPGKLG